MNRISVKIIVIVFSFFIPFFFTVIPWKISPWMSSFGSKGARALSCILCYGGGIFLGTYLTHLTPEARNLLNETLLTPNHIDYPVVDVLIGGGFFFVLLLDNLIVLIKSRKKKGDTHTEQCITVLSEITGSDQTIQKVEDESQVDNDVKICICENRCDQSAPIDEDRISTTSISTGRKSLGCISFVNNLSSDNNIDRNSTGRYSLGNNSIGRNSNGGQNIGGSDICSNNIGNSDIGTNNIGNVAHTHSHFNKDHQIRSIVMVIALSMHHFFEGMILGLQETIQNLFIIAIALMIHECVIQFSLGLQLVKAGVKLKPYVVTSVSVCCIMPLGVGLGTLLTEIGSNQFVISVVSGFLQAFASGTFLYVIFFEIFIDELTPEATNLLKILCSFFGFATMALLKLVPEDSAQTNCNPDCEPLTNSSFNSTTNFSSIYGVEMR